MYTIAWHRGYSHIRRGLKSCLFKFGSKYEDQDCKLITSTDLTLFLHLVANTLKRNILQETARVFSP